MASLVYEREHCFDVVAKSFVASRKLNEVPIDIPYHVIFPVLNTFTLKLACLAWRFLSNLRSIAKRESRFAALCVRVQIA